MQSLSREHIKYTLGIDVSLNESISFTEEQYILIIEAQLLYENFFDSVKKYAGEIKNTFLKGFSDFKDFASTLYRIINDKLSTDFADSLLRTFVNSDIKKTIDTILQKIGQPDLLKNLTNKIKLISNPVGKLIASIGFTTVAKFFYDKFKDLDLTKDNIKQQVSEYIKSFLSDTAIETLESFFTGGFSTLKQWLEKIGIGAATIYNTLKGTINKYKDAFMKQDAGDKWAVKLVREELNEGEFCPQCLAQYIREHINSLQEAEYQGRKVPLGKPMRGDIKKFKVYVKNNKGNVVKVNFGDPNMKIKKNIPARRKSFRARHHCDTNPGPRWKARYWSCRKW
jgi:hypothetical protein